MIDQDAFASLSMERAFRIAAEVTGQAPSKAKRFANGMRHYVFEVEFPKPTCRRAHRKRGGTAEMAGAVHLSAMLRQRGVPLPTMLASNVEAEKPWLVLERLAGTDLGNVIQRLSREQLELIAARVAEAQAITAQTGSAGRYGYAVRP